MKCSICGGEYDTDFMERFFTGGAKSKWRCMNCIKQGKREIAQSNGATSIVGCIKTKDKKER